MQLFYEGYKEANSHKCVYKRKNEVVGQIRDPCSSLPGGSQRVQREGQAGPVDPDDSNYTLWMEEIHFAPKKPWNDLIPC